MATSETKPRVLKSLATPFLAGFLALLPLVLTVAVTIWLGAMIHRFVGPGSYVGRSLRNVGLNFATSDEVAYVLGAVAALALIYALGLLVQFGLKNRLQALTDRAMKRIPLISSIYEASKKIAMMFEPAGKDDLKSMTPVLCTFGGVGGTAIPAFMPSADVLQIHGVDYRVVMIPSAPIPFGGAIMCVPVEWVTPLDCGIDGLLSIYMSMGVSIKEHLGPLKRELRKDDGAAPSAT
jgi:uncharacterized membrane protein